MRDESILLRLEAEGQPAPRVQLRAIDGVVERAERRTGRYEILGELASGGVGQILKGRDIDLGRDVALKVLRDKHVDNPELMRRLVEEAQIAGQLNHPGIVPVYELGLQKDRRPFFAMKLIKGRTLAEVLGERGAGAPDRRRYLQVFEQVCRAVAYAHARGVVHRDLKPSNVMVGSFGEVQVVDWGFAKVLPRGGIADERRPKQPELTLIETLRSEHEGTDSVAGSIMGTPAYMSPEQALGHVDQLDERSDVFSLGAMLCEFLTGEPPYTSENVIDDAAQARLDDAKERLDACDADPDLVDLACFCLRPLRSERPRHAGVVADALAKYLTSVDKRTHRAELTAAEARAEAERVRESVARQRRAHRQSVFLVAWILLAMLAGGGSYAWIEARSRDRAERAEADASDALERAQRMRGLRRWAQAQTAAEHAIEVARADGVAESTRRHARRLLEAIVGEEERAKRAEQRRDADDRLLTGLAEARLRWSDELNHIRTDETFARVFREWGLRVEDPTETADAVRERGPAFAREVAAALEDWTWLRRVLMHQKREEWSRLIALADRIDRDEARRKLRHAIVEEDLPSLRSFVGSANVDHHSPQ
ncbi:MAG: serine/threonine-protein kinase, partial [Planctomycetota bacterium]